MWHCVISGGVIACQSARKCFKYYNLWYAVRFAWCYWEKISKFNIFHFLPASAVSVSDNFSSPHGDSRWGREKWLEVTVPVRYVFHWRHVNLWLHVHMKPKSFWNLVTVEMRGNPLLWDWLHHILISVMIFVFKWQPCLFFTCCI